PPLLSSSFFQSLSHLQDLPSFPTRRSSDLNFTNLPFPESRLKCFHFHNMHNNVAGTVNYLSSVIPDYSGTATYKPGDFARGSDRSEEHTSELQSREDLVCRLLLEKKKTHKK